MIKTHDSMSYAVNHEGSEDLTVEILFDSTEQIYTL